MWPEKVQRQFEISQTAGNDDSESAFHASYNKLFNTLFPVDTDFMVSPNCEEINTRNGVVYIETLEVLWVDRPVLVLALRREKDFPLMPKRSDADEQLRERMGDLIGNALLPLFQYI